MSFEHIRPFVEQALQTFQVPGLVIAVRHRAEAPAYIVIGTDAAGIPLAENSLFPVASITKLAVALAVLRLADAGSLDWHHPLVDYLPDAAAAATHNQVGGLGGGVPGWFTRADCLWGLGPALADTFPWVPLEAGSESFGHTGATGCLAWCDPAADIAWALLGTKIPDNGWCDTVFPRIGAAILAKLN